MRQSIAVPLALLGLGCVTWAVVQGQETVGPDAEAEAPEVPRPRPALLAGPPALPEDEPMPEVTRDEGMMKLAAALLEARHGVKVTWPDAVKRGQLEGTALAGRAIPRALALVSEFLEQYPHGFPACWLKEVRLTGDLVLDGNTVMGATGDAELGVIAVAIGDQKQRKERGVLTTLHHELAHVLHRYHPEVLLEWQESFPGDYIGRDAGLSDGERFDWVGQGFVTRYAASGVHEDFAETAELSWAWPEKIDALARRSEIVRDKRAFVHSFYRDVIKSRECPLGHREIE